MRVNVNLSREPFTNHRLFWIALCGVLFVSLWFGLWVKAETADALRSAADYDQRIRSRQAEFERRKAEEEERLKEEEKIVLSPQEATELASARRLIPYRAFSMSRMMSDLESYVPPDTRISGIKVDRVSEEAGQMSAEVEVKALGKTAAELTEMMSRLEKSDGLFTVGDASQGQAADSGEIPFAITFTYQPSKGAAR